MVEQPGKLIRSTLLRTVGLSVTVALLSWMALLVLWGTLFQVRAGLLAATQRFADAWFIWAAGLVPLPAGRLLLLLFSIHLILVLIVRLPRRRIYLGLWLIHSGFILLFIGSLLSGLYREEGRVWLSEKSAASVAVKADGSLWKLPVELVWQDARQIMHPGGERVKGYQTDVLLRVHAGERARAGGDALAGGDVRRAEISLNRPLRWNNFTFYQYSYQVAPDGRKAVVLLATSDPARWLPYAFSVMTGCGLILHFAISFGKRSRRNNDTT